MNTIATYIHHIDPVLLDIPGTPLAIRWYGLAYVGGFILGYMVLLWLSKRRLYCISPDKLGDFITSVCIFGVLAGGRLGEFFFYWLPEHGLSGFCNDPLWILRVWEGGMASHGGIIAVLLVALWYCRKNHLSLPAVTDGLAIVSAIGICFGRIANFINGELYGRVASAANSIAMKFPQEYFSLPATTQIQAKVALDHTMGQPIETLAHCDTTGTPTESYYELFMRLTRESDTFRDTLGAYLNPRYPSQLFEALGEGFIIFVVLLALRLGWKNAPAGIFSALFCFLYAAARISTECFREPDADTWHGITRGQYLSFAVIALGVIFLIPAIRRFKLQKN